MGVKETWAFHPGSVQPSGLRPNKHTSASSYTSVQPSTPDTHPFNSSVLIFECLS